MIDSVPSEISAQVARACEVIEYHLAPALMAIHLYGSVLDGGLKPSSDLDLLVTVTTRLDEDVRRALSFELLRVSAPPGQSEGLRALEVTVLVYDDVLPWRYPARRELQFGEWLRDDLLAGIVEPAVEDADLAILLTQARQRSLALAGPPAEQLFEPVPQGDFSRALADTLTLWNSPPDWAGDERNVLLALARIWYSAAHGGKKIVPKDVAASWLVERLPSELQPLLLEARQAYLGLGQERLAASGDQLVWFVSLAKGEITRLIDPGAGNV